MKINIYSTKEKSGGAAIAANRVNKAFNSNISIDSLMIVGAIQSNPLAPKVKFQGNLLLMKFYHYIEKAILKTQKTQNKIYHSLGLFGVLKSNEINSNYCDLVNIHWVNTCFISIFTLSKIKKPIIITLHDSWFFCGTEHHPLNESDFRYKNGYNSKNRNLNDRLIDLDKYIWKIKCFFLNKKIIFVAPSTWLYNKAKESFILKQNKVYHIPNPIDLNIYKPTNPLVNLPGNLDVLKKTLLFGAFGNPFEDNKGGDLLLESLSVLKNENFQCICVGQKGKDYKIGNIEIKFVGHISDELKMVELYCLADAVAIPSKIENLTQMGTEAFACGTPVVAFNVGGNSDIIDHSINGYLATPFDTLDFANGVKKILNLTKTESKEWKELCVKKAKKQWSFESVSNQYLNIFKNSYEQ